jgi:tetratricopeptide (TPR) repeat protein
VRKWLALAAALPWLAPGASLAQAAAPAASPTALAAPAAPAPPANSALDAALFYQLLIAEIALREGEPGGAYQVLLDAARRSGDEAVFRRAVEVALQARAGEQALAAVRAWRTALPRSTDALRYQLQILNALNRTAETAEPLRALLALAPPGERGGMIAALPRFLQRAEPRQMLALMEEALAPYRDNAATRVPVRVALARGAHAAGDTDRALALAQEAQRLEPDAAGPALLGLEWLAQRPQAEALVTTYLAQPGAETAVRLAYVRVLTGAQRYVEAVAQLEATTAKQPEVPGPWLTLGALHLELKHPQEAEAALLRFVALAEPVVERRAAEARSAPDDAADGPAGARDDAEDGADAPLRPEQALVQAWLMLAQVADQRGDFPAAERWLARIDDPQRALEVQARRAAILARQGQVAQARALIRAAPEKRPQDGRAKLLAEAGVLREVKRWSDAFGVLDEASKRFADDPDLLYEKAMVAEKLDRLDEMERLLRQVIALSPDNAHAHNALGYSLADRGLRLAEARTLIVRALELMPGDPFITDSLGWVEFRLGNRDEALRLLRQAWGARPDPEIGAHLGEVLWTLGRRDEALQVWRDARRRDAANAVLRETLARLKVEL